MTARKRDKAKESEGTGDPKVIEAPPDASVETPATADTFSHEQAGFPIVGIGASAGGLAAFEAFFSTMPTDTDSGMAFVLVQHLAPDHKSILTDLVQRYIRMLVFEVEDGMAVEPNCTYIIPPNRDMAFHQIDRLDGYVRYLQKNPVEGEGTGLGLAICRRIVGDHNGTFDLTSEGISGRGTTVCISLPVTNGTNAACLKGR